MESRPQPTQPLNQYHCFEMQNPLTLVEYSEQELCQGCRDLPPVNSFRHYQHVLHDTFKSFRACPCLFCIWLCKAQDSNLSPDDRHSLLEQNSMVALHPNLSIIPQTINLGDSMSNVGIVDGHVPQHVTVFFHVFTDPCEYLAERKASVLNLLL